MKSAQPAQKDGPRINEEIRSKEVQLIDATGDNKGVVDIQTAMGLSLIHISFRPLLADTLAGLPAAKNYADLDF